jgi:hypothetical protein
MLKWLINVIAKLVMVKWYVWLYNFVGTEQFYLRVTEQVAKRWTVEEAKKWWF